MCSAGDNAALPALGFPIREPAGHRLFSASPRLIAAVHALHRLLVPRHPPRALTILTVIEPKWFGDTRCWCDRDCSRSLWLLCSFQGSPEAYACRWWRPNAACATGTRLAPVSQSSTACRLGRRRASRRSAVAGVRQSGSVDVLGPTVARAARYGLLAPPGRLTALPRKEVIQPQLPLRLPCYDFTPVTSPTVDGSLPCGLGHRLRVLLTPVV
jgi:hypothetical protein